MAKSNSGLNTSTRDPWERGYTPDQLALKIEDFIRGSVKRFDKNGVIIGLSGGIDSSVVSFLSVRALGKDRVFGLIMPEKESSPENIRDAEEIADSLGIKYEKIDLTPFLEELGVYKLVPPGISRSKLVLTKGLEIFKKRRG
jgi:NAD+ synthase